METENKKQETSTGCELMKCKYYIDKKCHDPNDWINENGDAVCGLRSDAILVEDKQRKKINKLVYKEKNWDIREQRLMKSLEIKMPKILIIENCKALLKNYYGSLPRFFLKALIVQLKHYWVYIRDYRRNKKDAKQFWDGVEFTQQTINKCGRK